ncbi:hypothetical protein IVO3_2801 [plant metagenome]|uniref:Uncharacterized protein n=1 Tax=plant metagenome TaxID=1297885 RepID=A0A484V1W1_9ZZZZ
MKSWKDQLRDLKNALRGSGRDKERGDEKPKIGFDPLPAWLAGGQPIPRKPPARNPVPKPATPVAAVVAPATKPPPRPSVPTPPPFKPRIDDGCALNMPEWSDVGRSLQHPEHRGERSAPMAVRVGVDFGTAFTKVAIRAGVDLVPVEWSAVTGDDSETERYVVPGFVVRAPDGEFCWRRLTEADVRGNLKLPVIEMAGADECPIATVAYLALVIRYARAFLYRNAEIGRKLVGRSLRWELNIGCPTEPHENPKVVDVFRRIARTAWLLAAEDRLAEQDVLAAWSLADSAIDLEAEPGVVPEFVAQIAGYLGSPQVKEGLHALIDVGAATLDVATFNVVLRNDRASPPRIPIFFLRFVPSERTTCATTDIPDLASIFHGTTQRPSNRPKTSGNEMASHWTRSSKSMRTLWGKSSAASSASSMVPAPTHGETREVWFGERACRSSSPVVERIASCIAKPSAWCKGK